PERPRIHDSEPQVIPSDPPESGPIIPDRPKKDTQRQIPKDDTVSETMSSIPARPEKQTESIPVVPDGPRKQTTEPQILKEETTEPIPTIPARPKKHDQEPQIPIDITEGIPSIPTRPRKKESLEESRTADSSTTVPITSTVTTIPPESKNASE